MIYPAPSAAAHECTCPQDTASLLDCYEKARCKQNPALSMPDGPPTSPQELDLLAASLQIMTMELVKEMDRSEKRSAVRDAFLFPTIILLGTCLIFMYYGYWLYTCLFTLAYVTWMFLDYRKTKHRIAKHKADP